MKVKKKSLSNRIIRYDGVTKQWYCKRCKVAHNDLIIYEGESYCPKCFEGDIKKLPIYNQRGEVIG